MWFVVLEGDFFGGDGGVIKVGVSEEGLGCVGTGFEEVTLGAGELKVGFADVCETAVGVETGGVFRGGFNGDCSRFVVVLEGLNRGVGEFVDGEEGDVFSREEGAVVGPFAG